MPVNRIAGLGSGPAEGEAFTIASVVDPTQTFKTEAIQAVKEFKRAKPYRGTVQEKAAKYAALHDALCAVYGIKADLHMIMQEREEPRGTFDVHPERIGMALIGKFSVTNYLTGFAALRGMNNQQAVKWSVNLFAKCFPALFAELDTSGPFLRKRSDTTQRPRGNPELN